jgi:hypothetical protein
MEEEDEIQALMLRRLRIKGPLPTHFGKMELTPELLANYKDHGASCASQGSS